MGIDSHWFSYMVKIFYAMDTGKIGESVYTWLSLTVLSVDADNFGFLKLVLPRKYLVLVKRVWNTMGQIAPLGHSHSILVSQKSYDFFDSVCHRILRWVAQTQVSFVEMGIFSPKTAGEAGAFRLKICSINSRVCLGFLSQIPHQFFFGQNNPLCEHSLTW